MVEPREGLLRIDMNLKYFGTDGIRGEMGGPVINPAMFGRLGYALGLYLNETRGHKSHVVAIARDTRASGEELEKAFCNGLSAHSIQIEALGVIPTPALSMAICKLQSDMGVVITASHNPSIDNGIKLMTSDGRKLNESGEYRIEQLLDENLAIPVSGEIDHSTSFNGESSYINYAQSLLPEACLKGWKIVVDTGNGSAYKTTPSALVHLGAEIISIGNAPDGININVGCGSEHPETLSNTVREEKANLGIAHDGDADRLVLCDENGDIVDGDELLAILGIHALRKGELSDNTLVITVMSNLGLDRAIETVGGKIIRVSVGDRNVVDKMIEGGYSLGGESSGHLIFRDHSLVGDGLIAAIKVIEVMLQSNEPLSRLRRCIKFFPQVQCDLVVQEKIPLEDKPQLMDKIAELGDSLSGNSRLLVRYSGTESKIRLLVEGEDTEEVKYCLENLKNAVVDHLNVIDGQ
jgi:phosphoglucosamine mutase